MALIGIDYVVIVAYFLLVLGVAYWSTRKASEEDFLIAERRLGIIGALSSINATKTGSIIMIFT
ncbi:MAG: hypothetical protein ACE5FT_06405, partial [Candidatus Nanoarchaeia archaeon]